MKKKILNYENYEIYDTGEVFNTITGKRLEGSIRLNGYKEYRLSKNNQKQGFYAHRLVAEHFIPNPENLPIINHKDGDKLNNCVDNLEWVSYSENSEHAYKNNLVSQRKKSEYYQKDLENEIWKKIPEYPNYSISSKGRIKNDNTQLLLRPSTVCGYYKVRLSNNGEIKDYVLHRLIYKIFSNSDIPEGYKIDHIDGNKTNNSFENLRCVTNQENALFSLYETKTNKTAKEVAQFDLKGNYITSFPSAREAARQLELDSSTISKVCRGKNKSHGGYIFKYLS